ncbi:2-succinyl-6-hydroxy-2,4-cyclohexadiene-1-carboxylate synthase [Pleurocapsa sp. PCC 7319]|uniref:2-succinyl-6-hydroxy-2, 4-cyclohexadiene-1-carboxylate synthase n=1 Tax=Pleurocapsa sp. PCC 7319 TaxID=118161 RepID=UPI000348A468|nr:2-succinyl-6-hydroxy-2,4-cyclohexadiene-1-carboxylate synthase [Pleurocapsa sp. PCC 7319]
MWDLKVLANYQFNYIFVGDRKKTIILFLHGFMGNLHDFQEVAALISEQFCCLLIDLPGHGNTEVKQDRDYAMPNLAQAIIELLKTLKINQCFLFGYSMGGRIALYLTIYFPHYFKKVILESTSPGLATKTERDRRIKQDLKLAEKLESQDYRIFLNQWYCNPLFSSFRQHPNYLHAIAKKLKNNPLKLAQSLRQMGTGMQPSLWHQLSANNVQLLLVVGEFDQKFITINQKILSFCCQSKLRIVHGSGHNVHFEQPVELANLINWFFKNN